MDWESSISRYRQYLRFERGMAENSVEAYLQDVWKLRQFSDSHALDLAQLSRQDIQAFLGWIHDLGVSAATQARILSGLKSYFSFLKLEYDWSENPMALIQTPRQERKLPDTLSIAEIDLLISAVDLSTREGTRNKAMLEVLYGCGLRVSELTLLKISNLSLEEGFIKVEGKGNKERLVPIGGITIKHLNTYLQEVRIHQKIKPGFEDFAFLNNRGTTLSRVMVFLVIRKLAAQVGIQKNIGPHTFRHSFASHLVEGGADLRAVQDMLGHESITTTEIYTHLDRDYLRSAIIHFHPRK